MDDFISAEELSGSMTKLSLNVNDMQYLLECSNDIIYHFLSVGVHTDNLIIYGVVKTLHLMTCKEDLEVYNRVRHENDFIKKLKHLVETPIQGFRRCITCDEFKHEIDWICRINAITLSALLKNWKWKNK